MSRVRHVTLVVVGAVALLLLAQTTLVAANESGKVLKFDTMVGVPATLTGAQSQAPLRGINGGGIPWTLNSGSGELRDDGSLKIRVDGLVLASGANAGSNPSATFRALVSCVRADGTFANVLSDAFPATTGPATSGGGDASAKVQVALPSPCIAPIVFVTSAGGSWFAATGV
jgi:hypothetical protein